MITGIHSQSLQSVFWKLPFYIYLILFIVVIIIIIVIFWRGFCYRACVLTSKRETESEKSPPTGDGHAAIPSPPFSSQGLGHARTRARHEFKPPGLGLGLRLTTWESSDIAITLTAGPKLHYTLIGPP